MSMPYFTPSQDPGANFQELLSRVGLVPRTVQGQSIIDIPHATTCVAVTYQDGVVMAGDRRATAGNLISHRDMEKVVQADTFSGVGIAGAAGPAMEMIKLFQLQLEHYEKMEGQQLSLEGKANQLSTMVRANLPSAMQGLGVVPIFGGFEPRQSKGRLWDYDMTGGRYEEREFVAIGSGSLHAGTVIKIGWRAQMTKSDAVSLVCRALWEAADADSATGGPDVMRGIYPIVAAISQDGWVPVQDDELAQVFESIIAQVRSR